MPISIGKGSGPLPDNYRVPTIEKYHGKDSPNQHIYHFYLLIGKVMGNDALRIRLYVGSLKGITFDWFQTLQVRSIESWTDLEA